MGKIERYEVHEEWNHSGLVKAVKLAMEGEVYGEYRKV